MSDIFISYASQDRERILPIMHALEKTGWSIFWDRTIPPGKTWRQLIGSEIKSARCVVVVWTAASIESGWVQEEAEIGSRKRILIPVSLDDVEPPFGFGTIQSANLTDWQGDASLPPFRQLLDAVSSILGTSPADQSEQEARRKAKVGPATKPAAEQSRKTEPKKVKEDTGREHSRLPKGLRAESLPASVGHKLATLSEYDQMRFLDLYRHEKRSEMIGYLLLLFPLPILGLHNTYLGKNKRQYAFWLVSGLLAAVIIVNIKFAEAALAAISVWPLIDLLLMRSMVRRRNAFIAREIVFVELEEKKGKQGL